MRKGIDSTFLHYGVRTEDMEIVEQACHDNDIDAIITKSFILITFTLGQGIS